MTLKADVVGVFAVDSAAKRDAMLRAGGPKGQQMFDALQPYAATEATPPTSLDDMLDTYTIPDLAAVDIIARASKGALRFHPFMSAMVGTGAENAAVISTASGTTGVPAVITLSGYWDGVVDSLNVGLDTDTLASQSSGAIVPIPAGDAAAAAAALAPLLQAAFTDVSVTDNGATLEFLAINTATTVDLTGAVAG
jgi:hypothetical protein